MTALQDDWLYTAASCDIYTAKNRSPSKAIALETYFTLRRRNQREKKVTCLKLFPYLSIIIFSISLSLPLGNCFRWSDISVTKLSVKGNRSYDAFERTENAKHMLGWSIYKFLAATLSLTWRFLLGNIFSSASSASGMAWEIRQKFSLELKRLTKTNRYEI